MAYPWRFLSNYASCKWEGKGWEICLRRYAWRAYAYLRFEITVDYRVITLDYWVISEEKVQVVVNMCIKAIRSSNPVNLHRSKLRHLPVPNCPTPVYRKEGRRCCRKDWWIPSCTRISSKTIWFNLSWSSKNWTCCYFSNPKHSNELAAISKGIYSRPIGCR